MKRRTAIAARQPLQHPQPFEVIDRQRHVFADALLADEPEELVRLPGLPLMAERKDRRRILHRENGTVSRLLAHRDHAIDVAAQGAVTAQEWYGHSATSSPTRHSRAELHIAA